MNCIFEGDTAPAGKGGAVFDGATSGGGTPPTVTYTCIQNKSQLNDTGNISGDPGFPHDAQGDYRLDSDSPCRDTGLTTVLPADVADLDDDTGEPIRRDLSLYARVDGTVVDMGAHEYQPAMVDCNGNIVPDGCDINDCPPEDPSCQDCNANWAPDECDIALGPGFGSPDCNDNDIPDECDIADCDPEDSDCQQCNANGYPDSCDIAAEISLDEDENGIPDECEGGGDDFAGGTPTPPDEGEGFAGGTPTPPDEGEGLAGGTPTLPGDPEAYFDAWIEYYEWMDEQEWGPDSELTGAEQFQLMVDKLIELGLPMRNPRS